jgi:hypothetical protein
LRWIAGIRARCCGRGCGTATAKILQPILDNQQLRAGSGRQNWLAEQSPAQDWKLDRLGEIPAEDE